MADTGIDPVVTCGTLKELLTGRPFEQVLQDPRRTQPLAIREGGERLVVPLTEGLVDALAGADADRLAEVVAPWSQTEEFWGRRDPNELSTVLHDLAQLARDACSRSDSVYCWICV